MIDVKLEIEGVKGYTVLLNNFNLLPEYISLEFPENIESYLDNLVSLGLLRTPSGKIFSIKSIYNHLKEHEKVKELEKKITDKQKITFELSRIDLTSLSLKLLSMCKKQ
jgi:hypothetical protein